MMYDVCGAECDRDCSYERVQNQVYLGYAERRRNMVKAKP